MIGQQTIERIRERTSISEIVSESVKLERRGRSLVGLCPFHKEKTPSFHVNEERGRYHCFGCQESGDVFRFVQETEGLSFIEAIKRLGDRAGIKVEDDLSDAERRQEAAARKRELELYQVNAVASEYFERMLREHPQRRGAVEELERRGLPPQGEAREVLKAFHLGYAPAGWDGLTSHLRTAGMDLRAAETVGLIAPRKQGGGHYDRFRNRLMFAVLDLQGRIIAFSGRALPSAEPEEDPPAKYINSPESPIYRKRQAVFGLYQARSSLRSGRAALLVEGNFDVVSLHARGVSEAVAPLGTALTLEQSKNIRRFTGHVIVCFDGDRAGRDATAKARGPLVEAGLTARVARLPEGTDPDDFVRARGEESLRQLLGAARGMLDHLIAELLDEQFMVDDAEARGRKLHQVLDLLKAEEDPTVRALAEQYADMLASRLGVADARTFRALKSSVERSLRGARDGAPPARRTRASPGERGEWEMTTAIVGALLDFPALLDSEDLLAYGTQMQGDLAAVVACLRRARRQSPSRGELDLNQTLAKIPEAIRPFVEARIAAPLHAEVKTAQLELSGNLRKLMDREHSRLTVGVVSDLEKARLSGDFEQELALLQGQQERARRRRGMD